MATCGGSTAGRFRSPAAEGLAGRPAGSRGARAGGPPQAPGSARPAAARARGPQHQHTAARRLLPVSTVAAPSGRLLPTRRLELRGDNGSRTRPGAGSLGGRGVPSPFPSCAPGPGLPIPPPCARPTSAGTLPTPRPCAGPVGARDGRLPWPSPAPG